MDATPIYGIEPDYSEGCAVFADTFYDIATSLVPIDTGYLESTIGAEGYDTWCEAYADAEYAQYVEYGTWKMDAQPYFEPAYRRALGEAMPLWQEAQEAAIQEEEERQAEESAESEEGGIGFFGLSLIDLFATMIVSAAIITVKVALGADYSSRGQGGSRGGGGSGFVPEVEIT